MKSPPFTRNEAPELIGTLFCFNVTNRLVNIFLGESALPISKERKLLRAIMEFMATRIMLKPLVTKKLKGGESLSLIPVSNGEKLPKWVGEVENISIAFSAVTAHVKKIEKELIPKSIVEKVNSALENWNGQQLPSRGEWLDESIKDLNGTDQTLAKLVLLVMFASFSVTEKDIVAFRKIHPGDKELIDYCYWAATKATIRILDWVAMPFL